MKIKDILEALEGVDPDKDIRFVGEFCDYEIVGVFDGEFGIEVEVREGQ